MKRMMSVYLPSLAIELARRRSRRRRRSAKVDPGNPPDRTAPLLLTRMVQGQQIVERCDARSAARGVRPGMTLANWREP